MSIVISEQTPNTQIRRGVFNNNNTLAIGDLLIRDLTRNCLTTVSGTYPPYPHNIEGISKTTIATAGTSVISYTPIVLGQYVIADCTSNTAKGQLFFTHTMTDTNTVANSTTNIATSAGVFVATELYGAAADKKLIGYFIKQPQGNTSGS